MLRPLKQQSNRNPASLNRVQVSARRTRRGVTALELMVSAAILLATVSVITTLIFKCGMIWKDVSQRRVAVRELSSQLEELTLLDQDAAKKQLDQLELSKICSQRLPEAKLVGALSEDNLGVRIQLSLNWKRPVESKPVVLCGWLIEAEETQ